MELPVAVILNLEGPPNNQIAFEGEENLRKRGSGVNPIRLVQWMNFATDLCGYTAIKRILFVWAWTALFAGVSWHHRAVERSLIDSAAGFSTADAQEMQKR